MFNQNHHTCKNKTQNLHCIYPLDDLGHVFCALVFQTWQSEKFCRLPHVQHVLLIEQRCQSPAAQTLQTGQQVHISYTQHLTDVLMRQLEHSKRTLNKCAGTIINGFIPHNWTDVSVCLCVYLSVVAVDVVKDSGKQIMWHIMQGDDRKTRKRLQSFTFTKMILQQRLEIIATAAEKRLWEQTRTPKYKNKHSISKNNYGLVWLDYK